MSNTPSTPTVSKGRLWLTSFLTALCCSLGGVVAGVISQNSPGLIAISAAGIVVLLTPIFYFLNARRARLGTPPRRP